MRGVAGQGATKGAVAKRGLARRVAWQRGLLVSSYPSLSLLVAFSRTASAACFTCKTHPAERASTHGAKGSRRKAFLRLCWERREVGLFSSLSPSRVSPQMKPWGDAVMRDERIDSPQIIFALALKLISMHSPCYCFVLKRSSFYTRPDTSITHSTPMLRAPKTT